MAYCPRNIPRPIKYENGVFIVYRRVVLSTSTSTSGNINILYHVRGAILLSQYRRVLSSYDPSISPFQAFCSVVFDDSVRMATSFTLAPNRKYEFIFAVPENQPTPEAVEETSSTGVSIAVYNENGAFVCDNSANRKPAQSSVAQNGPGEMTSVPGEEPGEMTSVPGEEPGAMI